MLARFKTDPLYLAKYFATVALALSSLTWLLSFAGLDRSGSAFDPRHIVWLPLALIGGLLTEGLIHKAAHASLQPRWLGQAAGEVAGIVLIYTFCAWQTQHQMHHAYADKPGADPHPPGNLSFASYLLLMVPMIVGSFPRNYLRFYGRKGYAWWAVNTFAYVAAILAILTFWKTLLGPSLTLFGLIPWIMAYMLLVTHVNYATHRVQADGNVLVLDLSDGWYYRSMNFLTCGTYFHKTHHRVPQVNNPQRYSLTNSRSASSAHYL